MKHSLNRLYDLDRMRDRFFLDVSPNGKHIATGAYDKSARVIDFDATSNTEVRCKLYQKEGSKSGSLKIYNRMKKLPDAQKNLDDSSFNQRVSLGAWMPN